MENCILLRYGEIGLKSKRTRSSFEKRLVLSIEEALKREGLNKFEIKNLGGRFILYTKEVDASFEVLKRVAGIQGISKGTKIDFKEKSDLLSKVKEIAWPLVKDKTFGVRIKRIGKHDFKSADAAKELGSLLYDNSKGVNLDNPEVRINLEIRDHQCFVYTSSEAGVGGLPIGSSGRVLCLFSGGIDSPVAAFQMLKRGAKVDFLFVNLMGEKLEHDVAKVYNYLINYYAFNYTPKFYIVDGKKLVEKIISSVKDDMRQIALKISFYKIAEEIARQEKYPFVITGESLAQKSSQTLQSLSIIQSQSTVAVLRPLLTLDKIEITKIAQRLGTLASSEKIKEYCNLSTGPVTTSPRMDDLKHIPDLDDDIRFALSTIKVHPGIFEVDEPLDKEVSGSEVVKVDIRSKSAQEHIPLKTDLQMPYPQILDKLDSFEKDKKYLLICEFNVRSDDVAFSLKKRGIIAAGVSVQNYLKYFKT